MGFLSKAFKRVKKQIRPNNMMIGNIRKMPRRPGMIGDMRFRGRMPRRGGFGFGLGEAIRRLKQQRDMGMPRRPRINFGDQIGYTRPNKDPSMPSMIAGGTPGFYDNMIGTPQPIPRAEIDISALDPLPMGDMPMTQDLPEVSPVGMMAGRTLQQDFPTQPRMMMAEGDEAVRGLMAAGSTGSDTSIEQQSPDMLALVEMARNAETPEEVQEIFKIMDQLREMEGRPQLAGGGDFPDLTGDGKVTQADILKGRGVYAEGDEVKSFADYQPEGSLKGTFFDYIPDGYQVSSFLMDKFGQEAAQDPTIREMFEGQFKAARMAGKDVFEFMGKSYNTKTLEEVEGMRYGGEMERFQDGGEIDAMLSGMGSEVEGAMESMEEIEQMAPEMEMIDQLVTMVVQMIQQGASEEEVMMFLREQGLDDEDIGTVLQLVAEMAEAEAMPQDGIGAELEQLA